MLCDSHIHFIPEELSVHTSFYKGVWTDKQALLGFLERNRIEKALLVYPSTDANLKLGGYSQVCKLYNSACAKMVRDDSRLIAAGIVDLDSMGTIDAQVNSLKDQGFRAVSLASSYQGKFIGIEFSGLFEAIQRYSLAVFIHPQTVNPIGFERVKDPLLMPVLEYTFDVSMCLGLLMMDGVLQRYEIKFVFSSLAGIIPFLKGRFDRVYAMLRQREMVKDIGAKPSEIFANVYVDTSGAVSTHIQLALELFGEDHILWGSDYPVAGDVAGNLTMLDSFGVGIKEKIVGGNFSGLFE
jgi:predicted TIM-barrel fold metal-dependent hydrolase